MQVTHQTGDVMATQLLFTLCIVLTYLQFVATQKRFVLQDDKDASSALTGFVKNLTALESSIGHLEYENKLIATENYHLTTENKDLGAKMSFLENITQQLSADREKNRNDFEDSIRQIQDRIEQLETENKEQATANQLISTLNLKLATENKNLGTKVTRLEIQTQQLTAHINNMDSQNGAVYIRWGRKACPGNGTNNVYTGYIGGTLWNSKGGGPNTLCLVDDPTWDKYEDGNDGLKSAIYGTEVQVNHAFSSKALGSDYNRQDPPCVTCHTSREAVVMIPGRSNCYPGWTLEYTGYLVGGHLSHASTDYICLDSKPEGLPNGLSSASGNQHVLYFVEANCGSLPCPPYHAGREIACVVCSK